LVSDPNEIYVVAQEELLLVVELGNHEFYGTVDQLGLEYDYWQIGEI
jgi:hypothetical protein